MTKILVLASTFPKYRGDTIPSFVYELCSRLKDSYKIIVLAPHAPNSQEYEVMDDIEVHRFRYLPAKWEKIASGGGIIPNINKNKLLIFQIPFFLISFFFAIKKLIKQEKIEMIHAHWVIPQARIATIYKRLINKNIKIYATAHGGDVFGLNNKIGNSIKRKTLSFIDKLSVVSQALKTRVLELGYKKEVYVYPMGVDTTLFSRDKNDPSIRKQLNIEGTFLLFVGRIAEKKGINYLVEALPDILQHDPKAKLVIIGNGPQINEIEEIIKRLDVKQSVIPLGFISHDKLASYYASADIIVVPSIVTESGDSEGFSLVFAEAMSSGTAVIATDIANFQDFAHDQPNVFLIPQKSSKAIAEKVTDLIKNPLKTVPTDEQRHRLMADFYDWNIVKENYINFLNGD